jgi:hypothetical protein
MVTVAALPDVDAMLRKLAGYRNGLALVPVADLPELLDLPTDEALDLVAGLESDGWVETWEEAPLPGPCVILSSRAAERLGLYLHPPGTADVFNSRWLPVGTDPPPDRKARQDFLVMESDLWKPDGIGDHRGLDSLADPNARDPHVELIRQRIEIGERKDRRSIWSGRYLHFIGDAAQWPVTPDPEHHCGVCHGAELPRGTICLWCLGIARAAEKPPASQSGPKRRTKPSTIASPKRKANPPTAPTLDPLLIPPRKPKPGRHPRPIRRPTPPPPRPAARPANFDLKALRARLDARQATPRPNV